ncbi:putative F-box and associated interaction domains-containing protein [Heracleum sosnowskyi]|uniref:F-box and associated interaction domains-containing protein n=1 Tax=Heracleum sosnowskyi TaxID=360622 RepID=A0AAD8GT23_9APIA|nr:putative F-box and associated interaction domains-containing protein [Heracleum sosnowskyi]
MDFNMENPSKKRNCILQEDEQRNDITSLPTEIALDIFSRLTISSLVQSRFVCRSWQILSRDRNLASLHLLEAARHDPLLIFHSDFPIRNQLCFAEFSDTDDDAKGIVKKFNIPFSASMPEFTVVGSCNGLLCLCDSLYKDAVYIYNPFTNDYKELPKTRQYDEELVVCGFGYHPETKQYKVVKIVYYWIVSIGDYPVRRIRTPSCSRSEVLVLSLGVNTWKNVGQVPYNLVRRAHGALFTCGRIHWLTRGVYNNVRGLIIVSFDLADEKFHEVPRPDFSSPRDGRNYQLTSLKGCLSAVAYKYTTLYRDVEIWVMKEYNVKESWIKAFRIGGNIPKSPSTKLPQPLRIWRNSYNKALVRVLCILENGEILIEYEVGKLALYDVATEKFKEVTFKGLPSILRTVVHLGSLNQIDLPVNM